MAEHFDAVILGAGPAGLSAALSLAWSGKKALVVEKQSLPREKVCGGFVGPENRALLELYGVWDLLFDKYEASPIDRAWLTAGSRQECEIPLSRRGQSVTGMGILRRDFDYALTERAEACGVEMAAASTAEIVNDGKVRRVLIRSAAAQREVNADFVIDARGSSAVKSVPAGFGVAAPFDGIREMDGRVVLHFVRQAHVGINQIGPERYSICYVAEDGLFKESGGDLEKLFQTFMGQNKFLVSQLRGAKRTGPWKGIPVGKPVPGVFSSKDMLNAGDTCAIVNPVIGGGITLALWGGWFAGQACARAAGFEDAVKIYQQSWQNEFANKIKISHLWGRLSHSPFWSRRMLELMRPLPALSRFFFEMHHTIKSDLPEKKLTEKEVCV